MYLIPTKILLAIFYCIRDDFYQILNTCRITALIALRRLVSALEQPEEVVMQQAFETHTHNLCLRLCIDLRIFHILTEQAGHSITAEELASKCAAETVFIVRIMRVVTALKYAAEVGEATYASTPLTKAITLPALEACMIHSFEHAAKVNQAMPEYFRLNGYKCPTNCQKGPFQYAMRTELTFFEYLHQDSRKVLNFNNFMSGNRSRRRHWVEWFPVRGVLLEDFSGSRAAGSVLLVDMGGGQGHDLERFLQAFPETEGALVLQDLPGTIKSLKGLNIGISAISHDIFTPQPIRGAKAYYTHFLLHDFPDDQCRVILRHVMKAMKPGYSRILLNESVLPDQRCPSFFAAADITLMAVLAGMKRSRRQWVDLVESVGLKVIKVWRSPYYGDFEGVVEAMLDT